MSVARGLIVAVAYGFAAAEPGKVPNTQNSDEALMALKLASSQKALEGLVEKDFVLIRKAGEELKQVEQPDEAHERQRQHGEGK